MPSIVATRRASSTADSEQQPPCRAASPASPRGHCWSVTPTTSCPSRTSSPAATLESTPPERATAIFIGGQSMTGDEFSALRDEFWRHHTSGRLREALAVAERAWDGFPERRGYAWLFLAAAHCGLGQQDAAIEVLERAESENHLWRLGLLRVPELQPLRADPRFEALTTRAEARAASRNFQPGLLLKEP